MRKWVLAVALVAAVAVAYSLGSSFRESLGLAFSIEGLEQLRIWVGDLGWLGPLAFVGLVTLRTFVGLSSYLALILGGLVFGALGGTLWGTLGLVGSGLVQFSLARLFGDDWVRPRLGKRHAALEERIRRMGPAPIFVLTAHPAGLLTATNLAAGIVGIPILGFVIAVALGGAVRAAVFSVLGTAALTWSLAESIAIGLFIAVALAAPLLSPRIRGWVLGAR